MEAHCMDLVEIVMGMAFSPAHLELAAGEVHSAKFYPHPTLQVENMKPAEVIRSSRLQ